MAEDRMLNDEILLGLIKANAGGSGTTNYNLLENKPQIAGTELKGNKSLADLGIASADDVKKEFIGTSSEWEQLSDEQKKEYDTYQFTDDYSEALMPNYSTTEQKTGQKWIDGKDIYFKTLNCGNLPNNSSISVPSGLTDATVIKMEAYAVGGSTIPLPYLSTVTNNKIELSFESDNTVFIRDNADYSTLVAYVILYYTKA